MNITNKNNSVVEFLNMKFKIVKSGLDENEVRESLTKLVKQRDDLLENQAHLISLQKLAEKTISQADQLAIEIKEEAVSSAKTEAAQILKDTEEERSKILEEERKLALSLAHDEAEALLQETRAKAKITYQEEIARVQSTLLSITEPTISELLARIEDCRTNITNFAESFNSSISQLPEKAAPSIPQEENVTPVLEQPAAEITEIETVSDDTAVLTENNETDNDLQGEATEIPQTVEKLDSSSENDESTIAPATYHGVMSIEVLPPVDINKIMNIIHELEELPQIVSTELIPIFNQPIIKVFLKKPVSLVEILSGLPEIAQVTEINNTEDETENDEITKNIQIKLNLPQEAETETSEDEESFSEEQVASYSLN